MTPTLRYQPALDGLRGIAIVVVLLFHAEDRWLPGGYLGVSTFFTLSGFLITSLLLVEREASGRVDLQAFWWRRWRRLMPAALLGIVLAAAYVAVAGSPTQQPRFVGDGIAALAYAANFRFMLGADSYWQEFGRPSPLQHYWSLSIEEQFYVFYPLLLLGVAAVTRSGRRPLRLVLTLLALASTVVMVALALRGVATSRLYYGTDTRTAEFLVGGLLATFLVRDGELRAWRGRGAAAATLAAVAFVAGCVVLVGEDAAFLYRGGFALYAIATAGLLNAAIAPGVVRGVLSLAPLRALGRVSYGVYVYHWPIFLWLDGERTGLAGAALLALQVGVTLAVAAASYVLIEQPVRHRPLVSPRRAGLAFGAALSSVAALVVATRLVTPEQEEFVALYESTMPEVGRDAPDGPVRILVVGDSLAFNIGGGLVEWAADNAERASVWSIAQYGCGLVHAAPSQDGTKGACGDFAGYWESRIARFRPDVVVILSGVWDLQPLEVDGATVLPGDPRFDAAVLQVYRRAVDVASSLGARVVWINTPCVGPGGEHTRLGRTGAFDARRIAHLNQVLLPALAASRPQLALFDLFGEVCPGGRYVRSLDGVRMTRKDELHLMPDAARAIAAKLVAAAFPSVAGVQLDARPARRSEREPRERGHAAGATASGG